ncbi:MAG TPA: nuclear transport factor 2 family protein [Sphingobacteriaceae bacterium]
MTQKLTPLILLFLITAKTIHAQAPAPDVQSVVAAENYFASRTVEKGIKKGFLEVSDKNTIVFRPGPVSAREFYSKAKDDSTYLNWHPTFARIAKSGDWGFTSGPFIIKSSPTSEKEGYGQYCSVWKKNHKGVWKLAMDIGMSHPKPTTEPKLDFASPESGQFFKQKSDNRLQQRSDIVATTDDLMGTAQRVSGAKAYQEFASKDFHFLFPGTLPLIGQKEVQAFLDKQKIKINTTHSAVDRAFSGDMAYTYGTAHVTQKGKTEVYNYVRIWQMEEGKWYVLFEVYSV